MDKTLKKLSPLLVEILGSCGNKISLASNISPDVQIIVFKTDGLSMIQ
jgi:hypothetical protein